MVYNRLKKTSSTGTIIIIKTGNRLSAGRRERVLSGSSLVELLYFISWCDWGLLQSVYDFPGLLVCSRWLLATLINLFQYWYRVVYP